MQLKAESQCNNTCWTVRVVDLGTTCLGFLAWTRAPSRNVFDKKAAADGNNLCCGPCTQGSALGAVVVGGDAAPQWEDCLSGNGFTCLHVIPSSK